MSAASTSALLDRLAGQGVIAEAERAALAAHAPTPWWLAIVLALSAWVASLLILASFFGPLLAIDDSTITRGIGGVVLLAAAFFLFRSRHPFTAQMALAFSLAGQAVLVMTVAGDFDARLRNEDVIAVVGAALAAGMMLVPSTGLHRSVCALIALGDVAWLIGLGSGLALFGVALAAASAALWLARARWAAHPRAALVKAAAHAATLAALCIAPYGNADTMALLDPLFGATYGRVVPLVSGVGTALVLLATVAWLTRTLPSGSRLAALAAALAFAAVAHPAPGLLVAAAVLLATYHACHRPWVALTLAFAVLYLGQLYFSLHITLLAKSLVLAASGALLLALRAGLRGWETRTGGMAR